MGTTDREVFDANYLLSGVSQQAKDELFAMATIIEVGGHSTLIGQGEQEVDLIVMLRGTAAVYKGEEKLAEAGPGAVIGEVALVDNLPRSANVFSITPAAFAKIDGKGLRKYMFQNREAGFLMLANLSRVLSMRLRALSAQVEDLKGQSRDPWTHSQ